MKQFTDYYCVRNLCSAKLLEKLGSKKKTRAHLVPEYDSRPALMLTHLFPSTVPVPGYKVSALYSGTNWYLGLWKTQCLNATLFCAGANFTRACSGSRKFVILFVEKKITGDNREQTSLVEDA